MQWRYSLRYIPHGSKQKVLSPFPSTYRIFPNLARLLLNVVFSIELIDLREQRLFTGETYHSIRSQISPYFYY